VKIKEFITKLQNLPDKQKKIILWTVVSILGLIMAFFWFKATLNSLSNLGGEIGNIQLPQIEILDEETKIVETDDWKTYTNDEHGFEIKYPDDYTLSERTEDDLLFNYYPSRLVGVIYKDDWADSSIYISADSTTSALDQCSQNNLGTKNINGKSWYIIYEKIGDAAMGGERGIITNYKIIYGGHCFEVSGFVHYRIVGYGGIINTGKSDATPEETKAQDDSISKQNQMMDDIISTFKFTD
jgi:hypothetical protein